jgi:cytochrome P450
VTALPPGPRGAVVQSARYAMDPYGHLGRLAARHGDLFTLPLVTGPAVILGHPEGARAVFTAEPEHFDIWAREQIVPVFGAGSIFVATGDAHRRQRRAVVAALHAGGRMAELVEAGAQALRPGAVVDVDELALELSLRVILHALFGDDALAPLARSFVELANEPAFLLPLLYPRLQTGLLGPWRRFARARADLTAALAARLRDPPPGTVAAALAAALGKDEALDNLVTLLVAGHETTAHATAWALYCLHEERPTLERLHAELRGLPPDAPAEAVTALPYLDAVCEETLRLHPIVVHVTRVLRRPLAACGRTLPAGVAVSPSACLIHRRPDVYPDPHTFRPERFLEKSYSPFESLPFGGGPSRCPGAAFGKTEMKLILFHILRRFRLEPRWRGPVRAVVRGLVMVPDRPLTMRVPG